MSCPSQRPNSEDTWPRGPGDRLPKPRFPRGPKGRRIIPPELIPPLTPADKPPGPLDPPNLDPKDTLGDDFRDWVERMIDEDERLRELEKPEFEDPQREPGQPDSPDEPGLETPDGIDLEGFEDGFEDREDFFHEDYEIDDPDDEEPKLTLQPQEQESGQNARLFNLWFQGMGQYLVQQQLPGLGVNTGKLLQPALRSMLDQDLALEYQRAENYYANLFSQVFTQQSTGGKAQKAQLFTPKVRPESRGGFSDGDLQVAAGVAITGIGILASYGFLYRGGRGGFVGRGAVSGLLDLSAP